MSDNPYVAEFEEHADWGVTYSRTFLYADDDGTAIPTTGWTGTAKLRTSYGSDVVLDLTVTCGGGDDDNEVVVQASATAMRLGSAAAELTYVWDIVLAIGGGTTLKFIEGTFTIHPTSSRS